MTECVFLNNTLKRLPMIEISDAISAFSAIIELAKTAMSARDSTKVEEALFELKVKYLSAMEGSLQLQGQIAALQGDKAALQSKLLVNKQLLLDTQAELDQLKDSLAERKHYALYEIEAGIFCYRYKTGADDEQTPAHYLCQPCWDSGKKSILRMFTDMIYLCPEQDHHKLTLVTPVHP